MSGTIKEPRRSVLTKDSLFMFGDKPLIPGQFTEIGCYTVRPGIAVEVGFGFQSAQDEAQGRIFIDLRQPGVAPGAEINGLVRIELLDAQKRPIETLFESRTELLRQGAGDRTKQISLPETDAIARENKNIVVQVMPDPGTGTSISSENSTILIDATNYTDIKPVEVI